MYGSHRVKTEKKTDQKIKINECMPHTHDWHFGLNSWIFCCSCCCVSVYFVYFYYSCEIHEFNCFTNGFRCFFLFYLAHFFYKFYCLTLLNSVYAWVQLPLHAILFYCCSVVLISYPNMYSGDDSFLPNV